MSKFLAALCGMTLGGSLAGLLLLALRPLLKRKQAHAALYWLYLPVLLRFLLPLPGLFSPMGHESAEPAPATLLSPASGTAPAGETGTFSALPASEFKEASASAAYGGAAEAAGPSAPTRSPSRTTLLFRLYITGFSLTFLYQLLGYARFALAVRRTGKSVGEEARALLRELAPGERIGLLVSPAAPVPLLMGPVHPVIVLPDRALSRDDLRDALLHELVHRRRRDTLCKWFMLLVLCVPWYDPLLYVLRACMTEDCELSCDAAVLRTMTPGEKQHYGEMLLRLSSAPALPASLPAATLSEGGRALEKRLRSIMDSVRPSGGRTPLVVLCALLLCGCGMVVGGQGEAGFAREDPIPRVSDGNLNYVNRQAIFATDGNAYGGYSTEITVSTVEELLAAVKFGAAVTLSPGVYDLSAAAADFYPRVYWRPENGCQQLRCDEIHNLSLRGATGDPSDVTVLLPADAGYGMDWKGCVCLNFQDISFAPAGGEPDAVLLRFASCQSVYIGGCVFSGAVITEDTDTVTLCCCAFSPAAENAEHLRSSVLLMENCSFTALPRLTDCTILCQRGCSLNGEPMDDIEPITGSERK